ncbi:MAG: MCE family protein [Rhodospirillales bacterium]|nr:MCE family protein [Rhodospirillales bacterium]
MGRNAIETVMGAVVLLVAGMFVFFAYNTAQVKSVNGYAVSAAFYKVGGLSTGSDVRISGIKVGTVISRELDPETYNAIVNMTISSDVKLPLDTVATIGSEGILGGMYVRLKPGQEMSYIESGGIIEKTQDFKSLEDQVGEIIFLATGGPESGS